MRAGYNSIANYDRISHGLASVGASANVAGAGIDYAFVTGSNGLGDKVGSRPYVSFRVAWAGPPKPPPNLRRKTKLLGIRLTAPLTMVSHNSLCRLFAGMGVQCRPHLHLHLCRLCM